MAHHKQNIREQPVLHLPSAFVVVGRIAHDEERLVLSKPVVQFSFTYGMSRGYFMHLFYYILCINMYLITSLFIYSAITSKITLKNNFS